MVGCQPMIQLLAMHQLVNGLLNAANWARCGIRRNWLTNTACSSIGKRFMYTITGSSVSSVVRVIARCTSIMHIVGVLVHVVRHRENIIASMIDGKKDGEPQQRIASGEPIAALIFLAIVGAWGSALFRNYDAATRTTRLPFSRMALELGDAEEGQTGDAIGMGTYEGDD